MYVQRNGAYDVGTNKCRGAEQSNMVEPHDYEDVDTSEMKTHVNPAYKQVGIGK